MKLLLPRILWSVRGVQTYALVGKSGSGKSFRARLLMEKYGITMLIDDGLLIQGERIVAGRSAKKEDTYMAAVRTALFTDKTHRREVRRAIERAKFKRILVLGTSDRMIIKICDALQLREPKKIIRIEEIATEEEIRTAINNRNVSGRHVIPVPSIEVKRNYPRVMGDSIRVIWRRGIGLIRMDKSYEKTVVRPSFSGKGAITISEAALSQMLMHCVDEHSPGIIVSRVAIRADNRGYHIDIHVHVPYKLELKGSIHSLQQYIVDHVERFTGILIDELNIIIDDVTDAKKR